MSSSDLHKRCHLLIQQSEPVNRRWWHNDASIKGAGHDGHIGAPRCLVVQTVAEYVAMSPYLDTTLHEQHPDVSVLLRNSRLKLRKV